MRFIWVLLLCSPVFSELSFQKEASTKTDNVSKLAEDVKSAILKDDINTINTKLKVEGATFRPIKLYLAPLKFGKYRTDGQKKLLTEIREIVLRDLNLVSGFSLVAHSNEKDDDLLLKSKGAEGTARITVGFSDADTLMAEVEQKNFSTAKVSMKKFSEKSAEQRRLAHRVAQAIYEMFIGPESIFLTQIAAIKRTTSGSQVVLLDFDGKNEKVITEGAWTKTSPYFSPDGKTILYGVISKEGAGIVEQEIGSKRFTFRIKKPGVNLDPRIAPDNSYMLATLSFENNANIYRATRTGSSIGKVTEGLGLNLSPSISPDGKKLAFVSDRGGSPQIYVQSLDTQKPSAPKRLTKKGRYNQTPHFSPDGKLVAFTGRDENKVFDIFIVDVDTADIWRVTERQGRNQEPYFWQSGRFLIFTSEREGKSKPDIFISTPNGQNQYRLTDAHGDPRTLGYYSPVLRPL